MESKKSPALTSSLEDVCPSNTNLCFLFLTKLNSRLKRLRDMSFCFILKIIPLCHTLPKALDMSRNTPQISKLSSNDWHILSVIEESWLTQESPGLKPVWCQEIRSFSIKNLNISLNINCSSVLLHKNTVYHFSCEQVLCYLSSSQMEIFHLPDNR